jgi:phage repressor protein C with HTH and peptisase S24 domain
MFPTPQVGNFMLPAVPGVWDMSDMAKQDGELRGRALYEAFMRLKPEGLAETDWAASAGVNRGFFTNLKSSEISPRSDNVRKLLRHVGRTEADLYAAGAALPSASLDEIASEHGLVFLDELDLALGMGASYLDGATPEVVGIVPFRLDWLRGLHEGPLDRLKVVRGKGDSMQPTIMDGDVVLIDTSQRRFDDQDRIWAIAYGDLGMIRRIRQTPKGSWILMPDNHVVRPEEVGDGEVALIGRVIWIGRRI